MMPAKTETIEIDPDVRRRELAHGFRGFAPIESNDYLSRGSSRIVRYSSQSQRSRSDGWGLICATDRQ